MKNRFFLGLYVLFFSLLFLNSTFARRNGNALRGAPTMRNDISQAVHFDDDDATSAQVFSDEDQEQRNKRADVVRLVKRGVEYINKSSLAEAGNTFTHTKEFVHGELYLFGYDLQGTCIFHGQQAGLLWKNLYDTRDAFGVYVIRELIKKAENGGGWVEYEWRGSTKVAYVQLVTKDDKSYMVGCGYHPHIKSDVVVNLVKGAVTEFNQKTKEGKMPRDAMSDFSYPLGKFIAGDIYLWAYDFDGNVYAHGDRPGLIGINRLNYEDDRGKKLMQDIISRLKETDEGVWEDYIFNGALKRAYAEKVFDKDGKPYFIAAGYYPEIGRKDLVDLVRHGYQLLKKTGETNTFNIITRIQDQTLRNGGLFLFAYDMEGNCVAHGGNAEFVGRNQIDRKDEEGQLFVREMINKVKDERSGWLNVKLRNAFLSTYVEKVEIGLKQYVIGGYLFPVGKRETMILLAQSAAGYLRANETKDAFAQLVKSDGKFFRGDLNVFAFDMSGICYAYGDLHRVIWRDLSKVQDDDGLFFVKEFINAARRGAGFVKYKLNGVPKEGYVELVQKDDKQYIVGSSYYQSAVGIG